MYTYLKRASQKELRTYGERFLRGTRIVMPRILRDQVARLAHKAPTLRHVPTFTSGPLHRWRGPFHSHAMSHHSSLGKVTHSCVNHSLAKAFVDNCSPSLDPVQFCSHSRTSLCTLALCWHNICITSIVFLIPTLPYIFNFLFTEASVGERHFPFFRGRKALFFPTGFSW